MAADQRTILTGYLEAYRTIMVRKARGLGAAQLTLSLAPSTLTIGGLLKHLALVEDDLFQSDFAGQDMPEPWASADWATDADWEFHSAASDPPEDLITLFETACARSRTTVEEAGSLDDLSVRTNPDGERWSLRWILVHLIEEYARHTGHADRIRESIDNTTGD